MTGHFAHGLDTLRWRGVSTPISLNDGLSANNNHE